MSVWGGEALRAVAWLTSDFCFFAHELTSQKKQPGTTSSRPVQLFSARPGKRGATCDRMARNSSSSSILDVRLREDVEEVSIESRRADFSPALIPVEDSVKIHEAHRFSERANWLVPGKILLGKYPGQIPADMPNETQRARDRIRDIVLQGGVTDILSLQEELPPQADKQRWYPPSHAEDDGLFLNGFRAYHDDALAAVAGAEVGGGPRELAFHHFPIPDLSPVESTALLGDLLKDLELLVMSNKVIYIHCWVGRGRTGLIAACLLGQLYPELSAEQSLTRVDAYYRTRGTVAVGKTVRVSPETEGQVEQVRMFFDEILGRQP